MKNWGFHFSIWLKSRSNLAQDYFLDDPKSKLKWKNLKGAKYSGNLAAHQKKKKKKSNNCRNMKILSTQQGKVHMFEIK